MISTVAVGVDGSATATKAVDMAAELARRFDAELVLLSVYRKGDPRPSTGTRSWSSPPAPARARARCSRGPSTA